MQWCSTRNIETEFVKQLIGVAVNSFAIDEFEKPTFGRLASKKDVGSDVKIIEYA